MKSKEELVLEQFFNVPKYWHFDELYRKVNISKPQLSFWLKKYEKKGLIKRVKPRGKMPYYTAVSGSPEFQNRKRLFGLKKLTDSGLVNQLAALKNAKVIIIFGSFSRYDWYDDSDIDIFIYGSDDEFEKGRYEVRLGREIQVHLAKDKKDLKRMQRLLPYIISGNFIKGSVQDLGVEIRAKT